MELSRNDVIVMATDGLWDVVTNKVIIVDVNLMHVSNNVASDDIFIHASNTVHSSYIIYVAYDINFKHVINVKRRFLSKENVQSYRRY